MNPSNYQMVYWRFKNGDKVYKFGYVIYLKNNLAKMGIYNGSHCGPIVDMSEIQWKKHETD